MDTIERYFELMDEAYALPYGALKVSLFEEASRVADSLGSLENGWDARTMLIEAASMAGYPEKELVAFSWMLSKYDEAPDIFGEEQLKDMLWKYKWVAHSTVDFPQISLDQLAHLHDDMATRFVKAGFSLRPVHYIRAIAARATGNRELALTESERWQSAPRDWMADCDACECNNIADLHFGYDDELGMRIVQPILDGELTCETIPQRTFSMVLAPLVRLGRQEEAMDAHKRGYRRVVGDRQFITSLGKHILFVTRIGDLTRGLRIFERHYVLTRETANLDDRFTFQLAGWMLLDTLITRPKRRPKLRLPTNVIEEMGEGQCTLEGLHARLERDVTDLAAQFNARNGNDYFTTLIEDARRFVSGE